MLKSLLSLQFGWQVCLKNKAVIHSGVVCLNPKVLTVIGGVVPSLYEEWQMNKKYSGFSRSSLRLSKESDGTGPPPFEKLQIGVSRHPVVRQGKFYYHGSRAFIYLEIFSLFILHHNPVLVTAFGYFMFAPWQTHPNMFELIKKLMHEKNYI